MTEKARFEIHNYLPAFNMPVVLMVRIRTSARRNSSGMGGPQALVAAGNPLNRSTIGFLIF